MCQHHCGTGQPRCIQPCFPGLLSTKEITAESWSSTRVRARPVISLSPNRTRTLPATRKFVPAMEANEVSIDMSMLIRSGAAPPGYGAKAGFS